MAYRQFSLAVRERLDTHYAVEIVCALNALQELQALWILFRTPPRSQSFKGAKPSPSITDLRKGKVQQKKTAPTLASWVKGCERISCGAGEGRMWLPTRLQTQPLAAML